MKIKHRGKLLIIGGAEDKGENDFLDRKRKKNKHFKPYEILKELLKHSKNKHIEIITTASEIPIITRRRYQQAFHKIHYPNPGFISIRKRHQANNKKYIDRIEAAGAVFFTGGDQVRIIEILGKTPLMEAIKHKYEHDPKFLIAGTSAGAMALSTVMIYGGGEHEAMLDHDIKIKQGLGILNHVIIDTHFIKRGRFSRLAHAVVLYPKKLGIGLGEDTALIVRNGSETECRGSGMVVIIDGKNIKKTNIRSIRDDNPIYVNNLKVHLLVRDCKFSFSKRNMLD